MLHMFMISIKVLLLLKDFSFVNCEKRHVAKDIVMLFPSLLSCLSREHWNFSCFFLDDILRISCKFPIIPHFSRKKNSRGDIFNRIRTAFNTVTYVKNVICMIVLETYSVELTNNMVLLKKNVLIMLLLRRIDKKTRRFYVYIEGKNVLYKLRPMGYLVNCISKTVRLFLHGRISYCSRVSFSYFPMEFYGMTSLRFFSSHF